MNISHRHERGQLSLATFVEKEMIYGHSSSQIPCPAHGKKSDEWMLASSRSELVERAFYEEGMNRPQKELFISLLSHRTCFERNERLGGDMHFLNNYLTTAADCA